MSFRHPHAPVRPLPAPTPRRIRSAPQRAPTTSRSRPTSTHRSRRRDRDRTRPPDQTNHHLRRTHQRVPTSSLNPADQTEPPERRQLPRARATTPSDPTRTADVPKITDQFSAPPGSDTASGHQCDFAASRVSHQRRLDTGDRHAAERVTVRTGQGIPRSLVGVSLRCP
jgi:hypothetical protein